MSNFSKKYFFILITILFFSAFFVSASNINGTVSPSPKWAFGDKLGWINFACTNCNVHVTDTKITGYAWSKEYGWINLSPTNNIGVINNCAGVLGGYAWSKSLGWLNFSGASINPNGNFWGETYGGADKAGKINFSCDHCGVATDWQQCALRESPAQVVINSITNNIIPNISANITITNEGNIDTEYQYEWCVVSDITNSCGGGDDIFYGSGAKDILPGVSWITEKSAVVPNTGTYYFKVVAHYGVLHYSVASMQFSATTSGGGGGGGGGGGFGGNRSGGGGRSGGENRSGNHFEARSQDSRPARSADSRPSGDSRPGNRFGDSRPARTADSRPSGDSRPARSADSRPARSGDSRPSAGPRFAKPIAAGQRRNFSGS